MNFIFELIFGLLFQSQNIKPEPPARGFFPIAEASALSDRELKESIIRTVSRETDFDAQIVFNVIDSETGGTWDCTLKGKAGELGCLQIITKYHNVDPLNFESAVRYFVENYNHNKEWWTSCSCVKTARVLGLAVPANTNAEDLIPNSTPYVGGGVLINSRGIRHLSVIQAITEDGFFIKEGNYEACKIGERFLNFNDNSIIGFYNPLLPR